MIFLCFIYNRPVFYHVLIRIFHLAFYTIYAIFAPKPLVKNFVFSNFCSIIPPQVVIAALLYKSTSSFPRAYFTMTSVCRLYTYISLFVHPFLLLIPVMNQLIQLSQQCRLLVYRFFHDLVTSSLLR
jgi:hypothetical protein